MRVSKMTVLSPSARQDARVGMRMRAWAEARRSKWGASFLKARSKLNTTSAAVMILPSWNLTPSRRVTIQRLRSAGSLRQAVARPARRLAGWSDTNGMLL